MIILLRNDKDDREYYGNLVKKMGMESIADELSKEEMK